MPNLNKVMLMGNLTRDPELRFTGSNMPVCKIGLAINRNWTDRQTNERKEETTFVDCTAFGRQAEVINQYCSKGDPLFVEGRLNLNQWEDQQGQKRSKLEVVIENFQLLKGRPEAGGQANTQQRRPSPQQGNRQPAPANQGGGHADIDDDFSDIPFAPEAPICGVI